RPEGPPVGRRDPRLALQRLPESRRRSPRLLHEGFLREERLTAKNPPAFDSYQVSWEGNPTNERRCVVMLVRVFRSLVLFFAVLVTANAALGQAFSPLKTPQASPEASLEQVVGVTEIKLNYHRPAVNKRKVWGELVPYKEVWRAGANENTTISFSSDV